MRNITCCICSVYRLEVVYYVVCSVESILKYRFQFHKSQLVCGHFTFHFILPTWNKLYITTQPLVCALSTHCYKNYPPTGLFLWRCEEERTTSQTPEIILNWVKTKTRKIKVYCIKRINQTVQRDCMHETDTEVLRLKQLKVMKNIHHTDTQQPYGCRCMGWGTHWQPFKQASSAQWQGCGVNWAYQL